jgi:MEMO1 family protein
MRVEGRKACGQICDATSDGIHCVTRQPGAGPVGPFCVPTEKRATAEWSRCVDPAAAAFREERARPRLRQRKPTQAPRREPERAHGVTQLLEFDGRGVRLAPSEVKPATTSFGCDVNRTRACPACKKRIRFCVESEEVRTIGRPLPRRGSASHRIESSRQLAMQRADRKRPLSWVAMDAQSRPALRAVESIVVPDRQHGRVLVLRDPQGVTAAHAVIPPALVAVVSRFTGTASCEQIAREASGELGQPVPVDVVVRLADELERGLFLQGPSFRAARARVEREFAAASVRPASHAGGAYHGDGRALERYIDDSCLARANGAAAPGQGRLVGLIAPHIDPWRGAVGYGHAYGAMRASLPPDADTFVVFGTSHAPMREPFALCRKAFGTPLGPVDADAESIDSLAALADGFDPYADQFNHKREHSLEFQVVFLKHLLKGRPFRIVPVLAGLGTQQATGEAPDTDARIARFIGGVRAMVEARAGRVVVVAGADLAHVGPRFGDSRAYDTEQRTNLERADRMSLEHAVALDASGFWSHVVSDLDERRVCGLAPIWSLLRSVGSNSGGTTGHLLHYEQTVDEDDGSIVSHAAIGFYA